MVRPRTVNKALKQHLDGWTCPDQLSIEDALNTQEEVAPMSLQDPLNKQPEPSDRAAVEDARHRAPKRTNRRLGRGTAPVPDYQIGSSGPSRQAGWEPVTRYEEERWPIDTAIQRTALLERISYDRKTGVLDAASAYAERLHFAARCMERGL